MEIKKTVLLFDSLEKKLTKNDLNQATAIAGIQRQPR
jgi:hypothetical protein